MTGFGNYGFGQSPFGFGPPPITRSKVFVSYHHQNDQAYYDQFTKLFSEIYEIITDTSIDRKIGSDDVDYQQQVIRENHITGSSMTIVLCGAETWKRRWIDWEIYMTLNKEHALLGIILPTIAKDLYGNVIVPNRLYDNIMSAYADFISWTDNPNALRAAIGTAKDKARQTCRINNSRPRMERSLP
jgi:hypothetical protein